MTPEQLQAVRAERWRQKSNPVLTLEDATAWIGATGLCLFLPRRHQFLTPAPSFIEATVGAPSEMPGQAAIAQARSLMIRLVESGNALPLNLFGALSEQPDFLASREAFPYIFSLRGGRNWKTPPAKATPLATRIWKLLEDDASLETTEIQAALGHEITESAVLRSLMDLWGGLRVMPHYAEEGPTRWELTQTRYEDALNAANRIAQTTALSALVSLYLESAVAATPEEIETFLSPLTARSKAREVVNGLAATRQLGIAPVGTQTTYYIAGSLPEFPEAEAAPSEAAAEQRIRTGERVHPSDRPRLPREKRGPERRPPFGRDRTADRERTERPKREGFATRSGEGSERRRPFGGARGDRPAFRKFEAGKPGAKFPRREERGEGERRTFGKRPFGQRPDNRPARPDDADRAEGRRDFRSGSGKFPPRKFGAGAKFPPKKFDAGKPRSWKSGDARPTRSASSEGRPFRPRREEPSGRPGRSRPYGAGKPRDGEKRPFFRNKGSKPGGTVDDRSGSAERSGPPRREWKPKASGFSKPGFGKPKFGAGRPGGSKFGGKKYGGAQSRGKSGAPKSGYKSGSKPPFKKRKGNGSKDNKSFE